MVKRMRCRHERSGVGWQGSLVVALLLLAAYAGPIFFRLGVAAVVTIKKETHTTPAVNKGVSNPVRTLHATLVNEIGHGYEGTDARVHALRCPGGHGCTGCPGHDELWTGK